jgi:MFS transporter, DHA1 family, multidrug resistance protein
MNSRITEDKPRKEKPLPGAKELVAMMAFVMALNALAIDTMLPAFPQMRESLNITNHNDIQYVVGVYLLGIGLGSIVYGPLSDRFGRKAVLLPSMFGFGLFSLGCGAAWSFEILLAMRLVQGLFGAASGVLVAAIIRDRFDGDAMAKHMSMIFMTFMIVPVIAPSFGAVIIQFAPWQSIFDMLAFMTLLLGYWVYRRLPETLDQENVILLRLGNIANGWKTAATNRQGLGYVLAAAMTQGAMYGYLNASEQLFSDAFNARDFFPIGFAIVALGIAASNFTNSRIVERFGARRVSQSAIFLFIFFGLLQFLGAVLAPKSLPLFMALLTCNMALVGFLGSNFSSIAMQPFAHLAGVASSFQQCVRTILSAAIGIAIGSQFNGTAAPIALGFSLCGIASLLMVLWTEKGKLFTRPGTTKLHHMSDL